MGKVDAWLRSTLWENHLPETPDAKGTPPFEVHRLKGRLVLKDGTIRMVQGVREIFEIFDVPSAEDAGQSAKTGKMVVIGRHIDEVAFCSSLQATLGLASDRGR